MLNATCCGSPQNSKIECILRVSEIYQNCRYAKKTQISLDLKKYRYVGDTTGFRIAKKAVLYSRKT